MTLDETATTPSTAPTTGQPLTATQLLAHPAYPTNDWSNRIPPTATGHVPINGSSSRPSGPFSIYYELHGSGPRKIIWIMGLGAYRTAWKRQSRYFGHEGGRGESTREMAGDAVELLAHLGWIGQDTAAGVLRNLYGKQRLADAASTAAARRDINVAGVSMGGMIAQELALLIPERVQSLFLVSTAPRLVRTVPFIENLRQRINMFIPKNIDVQLEEIAHRLFSTAFLESPDTENEDPHLNFPTNRDRFAASELAKRRDKDGFTRKGFILQAVAAGWHHKSAEQLREIVERVGARRVCVMHGTGDQMITFRHSELFREDMGLDCGVEFRTWEGAGHVLMWEEEQGFNAAVEEVLERTAGLEG
ncbi:hypothetical protein LTR70_004086 [Exophiala xenobiotica]|uniref:AB hydrolase-1 domain-containing protein n=1 Tax=Lithohypha guttulata TaxID=1690604 RepID=A0ABR0KEH3_9EURO|nr:hypothetical protein LTR24_003634 [Lithohypha guttulata]KAK5321531.1 hypothetical protein LTR70_004086 [Exophiala xenobiotica]